MAQSNPSTLDTSIIVTLDLGTVEAADITSITYVDASGATVTTTVAALQAGLALTIPATPSGSAPWSPVFTITATQDTIYEVSEALTMNLALAPGETDAILGTAVATGTIYDEDSTAPTAKIDAPLGTNPTDKLGDQPVVSITATDPAAVEGTTNSTIVFTVSQTNLSTVDTTVLVKGTLGAISAADLASISYTNATGTVVTLSTPTEIASFFSTGVNVKIPAGSTVAPVITFTAVNDTIFEQSESFSVAISAPVNATLGTDVATGTIFDPFVDANEAVTTPEDTPISGNVIDVGLASLGRIISLTSFQVAGDSTTYTAGQSATIAGVGTISIAANGDYTFTPAANYNGTVPTVLYSLSDDAGATVGDTSTLVITVTPVNDAPIAKDDVYQAITAKGVVSLSALALDSDPDGDVLSITSINGVTLIRGTAQIIAVNGGIVNVAADGAITFTPNASFTGKLVIPYVISDGHGSTATANEIITVNSDNPPVRRTHIFYKPWEEKPIEMGHYEFNTVILDFNGVYGGINQFSLPHGETTSNRGALQHSNHTPYVEFDRVSDEYQNAQRTINTNAILSLPSNVVLSNPVLPPDAQLDSIDNVTNISTPTSSVGGKGDIKLAAYTKNGKPLPDWIKFNRLNGRLEIFLPQDARESRELQAIGMDAKGNQAENKSNIKTPVKASPKAAFVGKESLSTQIKSAMTFGKG